MKLRQGIVTAALTVVLIVVYVSLIPDPTSPMTIQRQCLLHSYACHAMFFYFESRVAEFRRREVTTPCPLPLRAQQAARALRLRGPT